MGADSIVDQTGGLVFPLNAADYTNTLAPMDPARSRLLALFTAAINYELADVWKKITDGLPPNHKLFGTRPVQDTLELRPSPSVMQQRKAAFPLLCLHRSGRAAWDFYTLEIERRIQDWSLLYILPALDVQDQRRVGDVLLTVPAIVRRVIRNHGHKAFEDGKLQFFGDASGIGAIRLVGQTDIGNAPFSEGADAPIYYTIVCELQTHEYTQDSAEEFGEFEGADFTIGTGEADDILPDFIEASTDVMVDE